MQLHVFQSSKGDCLLFESGDGMCVLIDGGMSSTMRSHVRHGLPEVLAGRALEAVYVSHIDQDHISGVVALLQDVLDWAVYDYHHRNGANVRQPKFPRPPAINNIWHNGFSDQIGKNAGAIENLIEMAAPAFLATGVPGFLETGDELLNISQSVKEAIQVQQLASADLLNIPINKLPGASAQERLLAIGSSVPSFSIGSSSWTIVGPGAQELKKLREGWNNWLRRSQEPVRELRRKIKEQIDRFSEAAITTDPFDLRDWEGIPDYKGVTTPNIASLMFMVEEDQKRLLLTGDSQQDIISKGLVETGYLDDGHCHLDVLKVQHHGSENNIDEDFCRAVSADTYIFCGNGHSDNPELSVLDTIYNSRLGDASDRTLAPVAQNKPFTFVFSTTSTFNEAGEEQQRHMKLVEKRVKDLVEQSNGLMHARFNRGAYLTIAI